MINFDAIENFRGDYLTEELARHIYISAKLKHWCKYLINEGKGIIPHMEIYAERISDYCVNYFKTHYKKNMKKMNIHIPDNLFDDLKFRFFNMSCIDVTIIFNQSNHYKKGECEYTDWKMEENSDKINILPVYFEISCGINEIRSNVHSLVYHEFTHLYSDFLMFKKKGIGFKDENEKNNYNINFNTEYEEDWDNKSYNQKFAEHNIRYFIYAMWESEISAFIAQSYSELVSNGILLTKTVDDAIDVILSIPTWKNLQNIWKAILGLNKYNDFEKIYALEYWNKISNIKSNTFDGMKSKIYSRFANYKKRMINGIVRNVEEILKGRKGWDESSSVYYDMEDDLKWKINESYKVKF